MPQVVDGQEIDKTAVKKILIRATNWVGDVVMTLPALEAVRKNFPESSITILARPWVAPLFEDHPAVDGIITINKTGRMLTDFVEKIRIIRLLRKGNFDLAILFQNAFEAAALTFLGGCKCRLGYNTDGRRFLLTHPVAVTDEILKVHQVEYYLELLRSMGWEAESGDPSLYVSDDNVERARYRLRLGGISKGDFIVALSPGAIFGGAKRWPPDRFAGIGDLAVAKWDAKVLVMGAEKESHICNMLSSSMKYKPFNLCGQTSLGEAMGLISLCRFFVTNDSGLMHIAASLGVPTVAVFGPTDPIATGPRGSRAVIIKHDVECSPCLKTECPIDHRCMLAIEPEEVWDRMEKLRAHAKISSHFWHSELG